MIKSSQNSRLEEIEAALRRLKPSVSEKYRVKQLGIFGSYLRGEQHKNSDLDLLVEFSEPVGLFDFIRLEDFLSEELGIKVDLVVKDALKKRIKDKILNEALYV